MQTGPEQVLDGSSRGFSTANMPADRAQANQGKVPKSIPESLRDTRSCQKTWKSSIENGQQAKQSQRSSFSFKKTANSKTVYCTLMAQSPKTSQGGASPSSKVRLPSMKKVQSPMPSAGLPHPHRLNELATESGKWNGKSRLECVDGRHPSSKTPVGVLPWTCRSEGK